MSQSHNSNQVGQQSPKKVGQVSGAWKSLETTMSSIERPIALCYYVVGLIYYLSLAPLHFANYGNFSEPKELARSVTPNNTAD